MNEVNGEMKKDEWLLEVIESIKMNKLCNKQVNERYFVWRPHKFEKN